MSDEMAVIQAIINFYKYDVKLVRLKFLENEITVHINEFKSRGDFIFKQSFDCNNLITELRNFYPNIIIAVWKCGVEYHTSIHSLNELEISSENCYDSVDLIDNKVILNRKEYTRSKIDSKFPFYLSWGKEENYEVIFDGTKTTLKLVKE